MQNRVYRVYRHKVSSAIFVCILLSDFKPHPIAPGFTWMLAFFWLRVGGGPHLPGGPPSPCEQALNESVVHSSKIPAPNYSLLSYPLLQAWRHLYDEFFPQLSGTQSEIYSKMKKKKRYMFLRGQVQNSYRINSDLNKNGNYCPYLDDPVRVLSLPIRRSLTREKNVAGTKC